MKILMASSYLPYPLTSGGHVRLYSILKILSRNHQIILVCEKRAYQNKEDIEEVGKFCKKIVTVDRKKQWSINNILKAGFSKYPFLITGHTHFQMKKNIERMLREEKFDLIHIETFYVMQNLPRTSIPIVLTEHNIEWLVYKKFRDKAPFYIKPLFGIDIFKLKKIEEESWKKANAVVAVSNQDKMNIQSKNNNVFIVPNGVDVTKFKVKSQSIRQAQDKKSKVGGGEKTILFIGDFRWVENRDAARMILKEIWPRMNSELRTQNSELKLWIVGKNIPDSIKKLGTDGVVFDENAPSDTSEIYEKADLLLAPIRIGGGTSFKILEAMASGVPVITTRLGAIGIGAENRKEVIIADDNQEFADSVIEVLDNKNLYEKITKNARSLIEEKYNWENITIELEKVYRSVI